jgi:hypothetical protein
MITLDVRSNLKEVTRQLNRFERQFVPIATAKALTFTAEKVRDAERFKMESVFDRPTRWTLNSMYLKTATVRDLVAAVYFKDELGMKVGSGTPGAVYMLPHIHGGTRKVKPFERRLSPFMAGHRYAMPGAGMVLDRHGNIPRGTVTKILSQVRALGNYQDQTAATKKRNKRKGGVEYFWPKPGSGLKSGIYKRQGRRIMPALIFTSTATYRPRFPFYEFGIAVARVRFPVMFDKALEREMRKAFPPVAVAA